MSGFTFTKAVKQQEKLRLALDGPAGSGKTWTALLLGTHIADKENGRVAVIDSERSSARKYASDFDFDHLTLPDWSPHTYMAAVRAAEEEGYAVIIIDSFSHAWEGVLELKDNATARSRSKNSYTEGWREATPVHNELVDTVLRANAHVIATLRTKTEYVIEDGKPTKVGMKPIQRDGVDFEFDVVGDMTAENSMVVSKTRCSKLAGVVVRKPDTRLADTLWDWLTDGEAVVGPADAAALAEVVNAAGKAGRAAWLDKFGCRPHELPAARLAEAQRFVAALDGEDDPPPDGGGQEPGPGGATDREAVDTTTAPNGADRASVDTPPAPAHPNGRRQPPPDRLGPRELAQKAQLVWQTEYDDAPRGKKQKVVDRLRYALIYAATDGRTHSSKDLTGPETVRVWELLEDVQSGALAYDAAPQDDEGGVRFAGESLAGTVLWSEFERQETAP